MCGTQCSDNALSAWAASGLGRVLRSNTLTDQSLNRKYHFLLHEYNRKATPAAYIGLAYGKCAILAMKCEIRINQTFVLAG